MPRSVDFATRLLSLQEELAELECERDALPGSAHIHGLFQPAIVCTEERITTLERVNRPATESPFNAKNSAIHG